MACADDRTSLCERVSATRSGWEMRGTSVLLMLSLLSASLLAGCLDARQKVGSAEASAGVVSDSSTEATRAHATGAGGVPEPTVGVASRIQGDLARATMQTPSSRCATGYTAAASGRSSTSVPAGALRHRIGVDPGEPGRRRAA